MRSGLASSRARTGAPCALLLALTLVLLSSETAFAKPDATISGAFGDSCRDFSAHSSKDISNVVITYADGRVVKDETINKPDYSLDGGPGDEIVSAVVKSGTTTQSFSCERGRPPTAVLEIRLTSSCAVYGASNPTYWCTDGAANDQRTVYVDPGDKLVELLCDFTTENLPCTTVSFRGSNSTDPDNDITTWTVDFDDGTIASGDWNTAPLTDVTHEYHPRSATCSGGYCDVTLTVTDSGGRAHTDTVTLVFVDASPG